MSIVATVDCSGGGGKRASVNGTGGVGISSAVAYRSICPIVIQRTAVGIKYQQGVDYGWEFRVWGFVKPKPNLVSAENIPAGNFTGAAVDELIGFWNMLFYGADGCFDSETAGMKRQSFCPFKFHHNFITRISGLKFKVVFQKCIATTDFQINTRI